MFKRIVVALVVLGIVCMSTTAFAGGLWSMVKNRNLELLNTKPYSIEVQGVNIRGYVFEVKEMNSICISVWGEDTQTLQCKTYKEMGMEKKGGYNGK